MTLDELRRRLSADPEVVRRGPHDARCKSIPDRPCRHGGEGSCAACPTRGYVAVGGTAYAVPQERWDAACAAFRAALALGEENER